MQWRMKRQNLGQTQNANVDDTAHPHLEKSNTDTLETLLTLTQISLSSISYCMVTLSWQHLDFQANNIFVPEKQTHTHTHTLKPKGCGPLLPMFWFRRNCTKGTTLNTGPNTLFGDYQQQSATNTVNSDLHSFHWHFSQFFMIFFLMQEEGRTRKIIGTRGSKILGFFFLFFFFNWKEKPENFDLALL